MAYVACIAQMFSNTDILKYVYLRCKIKMWSSFKSQNEVILCSIHYKYLSMGMKTFHLELSIFLSPLAVIIIIIYILQTSFWSGSQKTRLNMPYCLSHKYILILQYLDICTGIFFFFFFGLEQSLNCFC